MPLIIEAGQLSAHSMHPWIRCEAISASTKLGLKYPTLGGTSASGCSLEITAPFAFSRLSCLLPPSQRISAAAFAFQSGYLSPNQRGFR